MANSRMRGGASFFFFHSPPSSCVWVCALVGAGICCGVADASDARQTQ